MRTRTHGDPAQRRYEGCGPAWAATDISGRRTLSRPDIDGYLGCEVVAEPNEVEFSVFVRDGDVPIYEVRFSGGVRLHFAHLRTNDLKRITHFSIVKTEPNSTMEGFLGDTPLYVPYDPPSLRIHSIPRMAVPIAAAHGIERRFPNNVRCHPDQSFVAYAAGSKLVLFDPRTDKRKYLEGHTNAISAIAIPPNGNALCSAGECRANSGQ